MSSSTAWPAWPNVPFRCTDEADAKAFWVAARISSAEALSRPPAAGAAGGADGGRGAGGGAAGGGDADGDRGAVGGLAASPWVAAAPAPPLEPPHAASRAAAPAAAARVRGRRMTGRSSGGRRLTAAHARPLRSIPPAGSFREVRWASL